MEKEMITTKEELLKRQDEVSAALENV